MRINCDALKKRQHEQNVLYKYNGTFIISLKKKGNHVTSYNTDEEIMLNETSWIMKRQIFSDSTEISEVVKFLETENKMVLKRRNGEFLMIIEF